MYEQQSTMFHQTNKQENRQQHPRETNLPPIFETVTLQKPGKTPDSTHASRPPSQ
jgi:hypothetical protein